MRYLRLLHFRRWSDVCEGGHDKNRKVLSLDGYVGQNMYGAMTTVRNFTAATNAWYSEVRFWPAANVPRLSKEGTTGVTGHYAAVIWAKTKKVGCGVTSFKKTGSKYYSQVRLWPHFPVLMDGSV